MKQTHYSRAGEPTTAFNQVYAACGRYVPVLSLCFTPAAISCVKCKQACVEELEQLALAGDPE